MLTAPICQDTRLRELGGVLTRAKVRHDSVVDLTGEEAFEAPNDVAFGAAVRSASCDVVDGWLVEPHTDDDGSMEGGVGLAVAATVETVPTGGPPGRGRDRARAA